MMNVTENLFDIEIEIENFKIWNKLGPSVMSYLVHHKLLHLIIPSIWHILKIHRESLLDFTSLLTLLKLTKKCF